VIGVARRRELGETLAADIRGQGGDFHFLAGDISEEEDCRRIVRETLDKFGNLDILINNAALSGPVMSVRDTSAEEWDRVVDLNLRGVFLLTREALGPMQESRRGSILNIASISGIMGIANTGAYCASKAGLINFTNTVAVESVEYNVRANSIVIGAVPSAMSYSTGAEMGRLLHGKDWQPSKDYRTRYGMRANPSDQVARALSLLCMDDAEAITGAVIAIDGGVSAGLLGSQMNYLTCAQLLPEG
jgi:NAD(P)-dependent dehydrogenase (short-subunit alcohol dehydrogenase family)